MCLLFAFRAKLIWLRCNFFWILMTKVWKNPTIYECPYILLQVLDGECLIVWDPWLPPMNIGGGPVVFQFSQRTFKKFRRNLFKYASVSLTWAMCMMHTQVHIRGDLKISWSSVLEKQLNLFWVTFFCKKASKTFLSNVPLHWLVRFKFAAFSPLLLGGGWLVHLAW